MKNIGVSVGMLVEEHKQSSTTRRAVVTFAAQPADHDTMKEAKELAQSSRTHCR